MDGRFATNEVSIGAATKALDTAGLPYQRMSPTQLGLEVQTSDGERVPLYINDRDGCLQLSVPVQWFSHVYSVPVDLCKQLLRLNYATQLGHVALKKDGWLLLEL